MLKLNLILNGLEATLDNAIQSDTLLNPYHKSDDEKGAIVVPTGFITAKSGIENKILKKIVDDKIIWSVVSMPSNIFANTGTNVSVLFLINPQIKILLY